MPERRRTHRRNVDAVHGAGGLVAVALVTDDPKAARVHLARACRLLLRGGYAETELEWVLQRLLAIWPLPDRRARVLVELNDLLAAQFPEVDPIGS